MKSLLPHLTRSFFGVYRAARTIKKLRQELPCGKILCKLLIGVVKLWKYRKMRFSHSYGTP